MYQDLRIKLINCIITSIINYIELCCLHVIFVHWKQEPRRMLVSSPHGAVNCRALVELAWQMQRRMMCDVWNFDLSWGLTPGQLVGLVESPLICNIADCLSARLVTSGSSSLLMSIDVFKNSDAINDFIILAQGMLSTLYMDISQLQYSEQFLRCDCEAYAWYCYRHSVPLSAHPSVKRAYCDKTR